MPKYAVAYLNLHNGEMQLEFLEADTRVDAAAKVLKWPEKEGYTSFDTLASDVFDADGYIEVKEIPLDFVS